MPRRRRYPRMHLGGLDLATTDVLLGCHRTLDEIAGIEAETGQAYDAFREFDFLGPDDPLLIGLWRKHRASLLAEWRRRGHTGPPPIPDGVSI